MSSKQIFPERLPRRRSSVFDDGPIKIYQPGGSPQVEGGLSMPAVAAIVGVVACAGLVTIYLLGGSYAARDDARPALEVAASEDAREPGQAAVEETVRTASVAMETISGPDGVAEKGVAALGARLPVRELSRNDPRWTGASATAPASAAIRTLVKEYRDEAEPDDRPALMAFAPRPASPAEAVDTAVEPDDETAGEAPPAVAPPAKPAGPAPRAAAPQPNRTAQVRSAVNMRAAPRKGASVLTVIPAGAKVGVVDCDLWCHVVHEGRSGYIFKDFVEGRARMAVQPASARATEQPREAAAPEAATPPVEAAPDAGHLDDSNRGR